MKVFTQNNLDLNSLCGHDHLSEWPSGKVVSMSDLITIKSKLQIMCRCKHPVTTSVKEKVSLFCHVPPEQVRN